jgi:hypothetical protein
MEEEWKKNETVTYFPPVEIHIEDKTNIEDKRNRFNFYLTTKRISQQWLQRLFLLRLLPFQLLLLQFDRFLSVQL